MLKYFKWLKSHKRLNHIKDLNGVSYTRCTIFRDTVLFLSRYGNIFSEIRSFLFRDTVLFSPRYGAISFKVQWYFQYCEVTVFLKILIQFRILRISQQGNFHCAIHTEQLSQNYYNITTLTNYYHITTLTELFQLNFSQLSNTQVSDFNRAILTEQFQQSNAHRTVPNGFIVNIWMALRVFH